ncbi:MAG: DUF885 domain-containing protein [Bacteroidetes bacterium]|nr:MAG: DUF885 domain-containing protein [Bacteroidota bacterium]
MKTLIRIALLAMLLAAGWWLARLIWFRPLNIDHFFDRVFLELLLQSPEALTQMGIPYLSDWYEDELADESPEHYAELRRDMQKNLELLEGYELEKLSPEQQLSAKVFRWFIENPIYAPELHPDFYLYNYPVKQLDGIQSLFPDLLINFHAVETAGDARAYIKRLSKARKKFEGVLEGLRQREAAGIIPPRFVIEAVLVEIRDFLALPPEQHPLYTTFVDKMKAAQFSEADRQHFASAARRELEVSVYPAYELLLAYMEQLEAKSGTEAGVWRFPDGDAFYRYALRAHTTTDLQPEEVFELGLKEVARIEGEMRQLLDSLGLDDASRPVGKLIEQLKDDPRWQFSDDEAGRQACLNYLRQLVQDMESRLPEWFELKGYHSPEVRAVPPNREQSETFARYHPPAVDGSRPGTFYINLRNMKEVVKFALPTLTYHEAIPGHHLHATVRQQLKGLPYFRKYVPFTAFGEGWALYAEQLAWEQGMYQDDPYGELGFWQGQMFRAVRLVVDVGIHYKKWTREQAITYMLEKTGMPYPDVVTEVERYMVWPGQACAYKIGQMKILELRQKVQDALGSQFELREFHHMLLGHGSLPLALLEAQADAFIQKKLNF